MSNQNQRILISCLILLGILCICVCIVSAIGLVVWQAFPELSYNPVAPVVQASLTPMPKPTDMLSATPTKAAQSASDEIPPYVAAQMDIIEEDVSTLRGLDITKPIERSLLSPEQLEQRVLNDFLADYSSDEAKEDGVVLSAFGLLQPEFDLISFYKELLSEQIAGFYDDDEKKMYVVQEQAFEGTQRMTYAHEYTHALQDNVFDFENGLGYNEDTCDKDSEKCAAIQALIEGDATLAELTWFQEYSTQEDQQQVMDFYSSYESPVYDSAPEFLKQDFIFPYQNGLEFVQSLYDSGGWAAVDGAFENLPLSTEQILHPEKYPSEQPVQVTLPDLSSVIGDNWALIDEGVMGEWYTYLILGYGADLEGRVDLEVTENAAKGWGGDRYAVYYDDEQASPVMVIKYAWDSVEDAQEFTDALQTYATGRFGEPVLTESNHMAWQNNDEYHALYSDGKNVVWILTPDVALSQEIWSTLAMP
jgi:hypothetical protein